jgi:hypothetical protein
MSGTVKRRHSEKRRAFYKKAVKATDRHGRKMRAFYQAGDRRAELELERLKTDVSTEAQGN